jgi:uncharacterized protein (DUF1810 family)
VSADLDRFVHAQDAGGTFAQALAELNAGAKRSHWIWFVFPQLAGLGSSPMAEMYGLQGVDEAAAYLRHPVLRDRLLSAMNAVRGQSVPLRRLMGSEIDALKLASSMTLFSEIAKRANDDDIATAADEIMKRAQAEGFSACAFTTSQLQARPSGRAGASQQ